MGDERPGGRAAGQRLQHGRLHLDEPPAFQRIPYRSDDRNPLPGYPPRLRTDDQVDIALPYPRLLAHLLVRDGQRPQRLGGHPPGVGENRQFASP
uniref:Uncharacterized protein n=1 Tax=Mycobacterium kansasii TaxID=1768 RepID=A0A653EN55_MYCKA|nr:hypothetical protein BIN_B_01675 [Mycobacterium kansasii]